MRHAPSEYHTDGRFQVLPHDIGNSPVNILLRPFPLPTVSANKATLPSGRLTGSIAENCCQPSCQITGLSSHIVVHCPGRVSGDQKDGSPAIFSNTMSRVFSTSFNCNEEMCAPIATRSSVIFSCCRMSTSVLKCKKTPRKK